MPEDWSAIRGKSVLITGANAGIGLATVKQLAQNGARVLMVGRNADSLKRSAQEVKQFVSTADLQTFTADLLLQAETRKTAEWAANQGPIHVLINNVGAVYAASELTSDGVERQFAVNYLNQFLLTRLLIPTLLKAGSPGSMSRIVMVSSLAHRRARDVTDGFTGEARYQPLAAYRTSKLAQCLGAVELSRRLQGAPVTVNALCPGFTRTSIGAKHTNAVVRIGWSLLSRLFHTPETAARTLLFASASPQLEGVTGQFLEREQVTNFGTAALDPQLAASLWSESCQRLQLPNELELPTRQ